MGLSCQDRGARGRNGVGWYRARIRLPEQLPAHLYLYLGGSSGPYRLFVNGNAVPHDHVRWPQRRTYADVSAAIVAGAVNRFALRVRSGPQGGGLLFTPTVLRDVPSPQPIRFNLARRRPARIFMHDLHAPWVHAGVNFWWVDGGSGAARMPGLSAQLSQLWTNRIYYDAEQRETGERAFILARYGGWGSERYAGFFTGDTYSQWPVLAYEVAFTVRGGNALIDYISNDSGGFHGGRIPFALYARWIEFGAFCPILRLHSAHENPTAGNLRMPWIYGPRGVALMRKYFTVRTELTPYLYAYAWEAYRRALPIMRPLSLEGVPAAQAYRHTHEYFLGRDLLVAPVVAASGRRTVYLPPGRWIEFFTHQRYTGNVTFTVHYPVGEIPVFVRAGSVIPGQHSTDSEVSALDPLVLQIYGSGHGRFDLYQDDGISLDYRHGQYAITPIIYTSRAGVHRLLIGPTGGQFRGQRVARAYVLVIHSVHRPEQFAVQGRAVQILSGTPAAGTARLLLSPQSIRRRVTVTWR